MSPFLAASLSSVRLLNGTLTCVQEVGFNNRVLLKKRPLTVLNDVRLTVSTLHCALRQPDRPLLGCFALGSLLLLLVLLLHAYNHILSVQVGVG